VAVERKSMASCITRWAGALCRRLDGLPLAIAELAAAWIGAFASSTADSRPASAEHVRHGQPERHPDLQPFDRVEL